MMKSVRFLPLMVLFAAASTTIASGEETLQTSSDSESLNEVPELIDAEYVTQQSLLTSEINSMLGGNDYFRKGNIRTYRQNEIGAFLFSDVDGRDHRLPPDELPTASDPSDFHNNLLASPPGLSVGAQMRVLQFLTLPFGSRYSDDLPTTSYAIQVRPGVFYDTGAFESDPSRFLPGSIALDNTAAARNRGNIVFSDLEDSLKEIPLRAQLNNMFEGAMGSDVMQLYLDAFYPGRGNLFGRSYFVRAYSGETGFLIGKSLTAFGDLGSNPSIVSSGALPIGAVGHVNDDFELAGVNQLRLSRHWNNDTLETTLSLEESPTDIDVTDGGQNLHDWPAFVSRVRYSPNTFDSLQISAMYRPLGFINANFQEVRTDGWGLSLIGKKANSARTRALYFGAVGGNAIAGYIFGDINAAEVRSETNFERFQNLGGYVAFQQILFRPDEIQSLSANIAYGTVHSDTINASQNSRLQQAWCNLMWIATDSVSIGIEYQYGHRKVHDGNSGDNHRLTFITQLTTPSGKKAGAKLANFTRGLRSRPPIQNRRL